MAVQRSRLTVQQLRDRVRGDLGLRSSNLLTNEDLDSWGFEAQDILAREFRWYRRNSALTGVTQDVAEYDLATLLTDFIAIEEVYFDSDKLVAITLNELQNGTFEWRDDSGGIPRYYYLRGTTALGLYPKPAATDADALQIIYTALPALPTTGTDTYQVPTSCQDAIIAYCLWKGSMKDASGEGRYRMEIYREEWREAMERCRRVVQDVGEEHCVVYGGDTDSGGFLRFPFFDPDRSISGA